MDPYVILGVGRHASAADIASAYRRAARATHPDSSAAEATSGERFRTVSEAYETLRDPVRRAAYDLAHPRPRSVVVSGPPRGRHIVLGARPPAGLSPLALFLSLIRSRG